MVSRNDSYIGQMRLTIDAIRTRFRACGVRLTPQGTVTDTTPPTVSLTYPTAGAMLTTTVMLAAYLVLSYL